MYYNVYQDRGTIFVKYYEDRSLAERRVGKKFTTMLRLPEGAKAPEEGLMAWHFNENPKEGKFLVAWGEHSIVVDTEGHANTLCEILGATYDEVMVWKL